jgi:hypothetical protein
VFNGGDVCTSRRVLDSSRHTCVIHIQRVRPHGWRTRHIGATENDTGIRRGGANGHLDPMAEVNTDAGGADFVFDGTLFDHGG